MPIAHVSIMEGHDDQKKADIIAAVTEALHQSMGAPHEVIRVLINEVPRTQWGIGGKTAFALGKH
ncbi:tautomerase family protein [Variovorax sp. VNK109]|jgi:4-oxalocrotonate tautomerase|uniref:tautomerase family protein n=1 Tax=Variovorax sp. VNK109 TaxID=3400919 RepID=UPI003BFA99CA